jgi:hypothetical protein
MVRIRGFVGQRLQIFTSLCASPVFCTESRVGDWVWKLVAKSLDDEHLADYALKFFGALTSHAPGRALVAGSGLLALFSKMFLSSQCQDVSSSLAVLASVASVPCEIPQISLVISCLMQDLPGAVAKKTEILSTLIALIRKAPDSVQEHDLQNLVLPLLSQKNGPVVAVLAMKLFGMCTVDKLGFFQVQLCQRIYNVLALSDMLYPEVIAAAAQLVTILAASFDLQSFLAETNFLAFLRGMMEDIEEFQDQYEQVRESVEKLENLPTPA